LRLHPGGEDRDTLELTMMAAGAAARINDLRAAASTLASLSPPVSGSRPSEVSDWINQALRFLKPELRVAQITPLTLTVLGHPGQNREILSSPNLK